MPSCEHRPTGANRRFETYARLDLDYVEHWSLARDLAILMHTVATVVLARGSYSIPTSSATRRLARMTHISARYAVERCRQRSDVAV